MDKRPLILLCRHGSTALNSTSAGESAERVRGWGNVKLDEQGVKDAHDLAEKVSKYPIERIYSSPLDRARETADAIGEAVGLPVEETRALMPWHLGFMQNMLVREVLKDMKNFVVHENEKVPGGEPFSAFRRRALSFVKKAAAESQKDQKVVCLVSHTRVLQLVRSWLKDGAPDDLSVKPEVMNDYSEEVAPGGFEEILPHLLLGPEYKIQHHPDEGEDEG